MKVLFLDIDGVLNSKRWYVSEDRRRRRQDGLANIKHRLGVKYSRTWDFDPRCVKNLNELSRTVPGLVVVVSSTWRKGMTVPQLRKLLKAVGFEGKVLDKTGVDESRLRYKEIGTWLSERDLRGEKVERWAAVDDDSSDMIQLGGNFFKINNEVGLTRDDARKVARFLRG